MSWQPIETAPSWDTWKGRYMDLYSEGNGRMTDCWYNFKGDFWESIHYGRVDDATHWMWPPEPPTH